MAKKQILELLAAGSISTDYRGYDRLINFYDRCKRYKNSEVFIDLSAVDWIDANMCALIMAIVAKLKKENRLEFFVDPEDIDTRFNILLRNGFISDLDVVHDRKGSEIKLTGFGKDEDTKFIKYIENDLLSHQNLSITNYEKRKLVSSFLELFSNVQKHAQTDAPVFACGQYYPVKRKLNFTLVDVGVGYLPPIQDFTKGKVSTAKQAILWALKGNTTKKDAPGGLGLKEIQNFCSLNGARFEIITGDSYWKNTSSSQKTIKPFCGTTVNVIFDCSQENENVNQDKSNRRNR